MPLAFTSASSLFNVSFGPWLLRKVINPSVVIAVAPIEYLLVVMSVGHDGEISQRPGSSLQVGLPAFPDGDDLGQDRCGPCLDFFLGERAQRMLDHRRDEPRH